MKLIDEAYECCPIQFNNQFVDDVLGVSISRLISM